MKYYECVESERMSNQEGSGQFREIQINMEKNENYIDRKTGKKICTKLPFNQN